MKLLESRWNYFIFGANEPEDYAMWRFSHLFTESNGASSKRLEPCVRTNSFLAIGSWSVKRVGKDHKQWRGRCFHGQMCGRLDGSPSLVEPNLAVRRKGPDNGAWSLTGRLFLTLPLYVHFGGERHCMTHLEGMKQGFYQANQHCYCFKGNIGETFRRWVVFNMSFPRHKDSISWIQLT